MRPISHLLLAFAVAAGVVACSSSEPHDVTVKWSEVRQTIEGFGASSAFFGANITDAQADELFDPKKGIGLSLLRTMIGLPADTQDGAEPTTGALPNPTAPELLTAQLAAERGAKIWAAAWTPPPIWKTTNHKDGSGTGFTSNKLLPAHYQDYADYLVQFADVLATAKPPVSLLGLSPANEPDYVATWDNAQWTPAELTSFIGQNLGPALAAKYPAVKIVAPETAHCPGCDTYVTPLLADPAANSYVPIIAAHGYGKAPGSYDKPRKNGKSFWQTEISQENAMGDTPDPSMTSAITMMRRIHSDMVTTEMNAWSWWAIYITGDGLNDNTRLNPAFMQPDASKGAPYMFKRGYAFGNWSKFVRPGFQRVVATDRLKAGVLVEAYRDSTHLALIAVNTTSSTVSQKFIIEGNTFGTLTPWVTSAADSLAAKSPILATDSFTFELPPTSVVTFVNWDATMETPGWVPGPAVPKRPNGLDCSAALVPNNVVPGGVTDFTDWTPETGRWGDPSGLNGAIYPYAGPMGSSMSANVDPEAKTLVMRGSVTPGDYAGAGLAFLACTTISSFTQIEFTLAGSSPGCDMELQIKTFDQHPRTQTPPGGCDPNLPAGCYNFPVVRRVAVPSTTPTKVVTPLSSFTNWSEANAAQVVGLQWQFTTSAATPVTPDGGADGAVEADGGADGGAGDDGGTDAADGGTPAADGGADAVDGGAPAGCPVDVTVTGIKFLP